MGMASTVVFNNDRLHELEKDPEAGRTIARAIRSIYHDGEFRYGVAVCYGHADYHDVVVRSRYGGKRLDHLEDLPLMVQHMLKTALERSGYRVTKRRKPVPASTILTTQETGK